MDGGNEEFRSVKTPTMRPKPAFLHRLRAAALLLTSLSAFAADPPAMPEGWSDGYLFANGVRLHYYRAVPAPGKPVIVMAHGVTDNGLCWTTLSEKLQADFDIYMLDARGHGLSDPFTSADDGDTLIKDVAAAVKALDLEKPILMGHSMGAATVMRVGAEFPDIAQAVVMLDPFLPRADGGGPPERPRARDRGDSGTVKAPAPARDRLSIQMMADPETLISQNNYVFEDLVATGRRQFPKWSDADVRYWALSKKQYHGAYSEQAWQAMSGAMRIGDSLARIPVPALILKADAPPERRAAERAVVEGMERVKLVHIEGGGHNLHHDELQRSFEVIAEFLSSL